MKIFTSFKNFFKFEIHIYININNIYNTLTFMYQVLNIFFTYDVFHNFYIYREFFLFSIFFYINIYVFFQNSVLISSVLFN